MRKINFQKPYMMISVDESFTMGSKKLNQIEFPAGKYILSENDFWEQNGASELWVSAEVTDDCIQHLDFKVRFYKPA